MKKDALTLSCQLFVFLSFVKATSAQWDAGPNIQPSYIEGSEGVFNWNTNTADTFTAITWKYDPDGSGPSASYTLIILQNSDNINTPTFVKSDLGYSGRLIVSPEFGNAAMTLTGLVNSDKSGKYTVDVTLPVTGVVSGTAEFTVPTITNTNLKATLNSNTQFNIDGTVVNSGSKIKRTEIMGSMSISVTVPDAIPGAYPDIDIKVPGTGITTHTCTNTIPTCTLPTDVPESSVNSVTMVEAIVKYHGTFDDVSLIVSVEVPPDGCNTGCIVAIVIVVVVVVTTIIVVIVLCMLVGKVEDVCAEPGSIKVKWSKPTKPIKCAIITNYEVHFTADPQQQKQQQQQQLPQNWDKYDAGKKTETIIHHGILSNTHYSVRVRACNAIKKGPFSKIEDVQTYKAAPGSYPTDVKVKVNLGGCTATVEWKKTANCSDVNRYEVCYRAHIKGAEGKWISKGCVKGLQETIDVKHDTKYALYVVAQTKQGVGPPPPDLVTFCTTPEDGKPRSGSGSSRGVTTPTTVVIDSRNDSATTRQDNMAQIGPEKHSESSLSPNLRPATDTLNVNTGIPTQLAGTPRKLPPLMPPVNKVGPDDEQDEDQERREKRRKRKKKKREYDDPENPDRDIRDERVDDNY